jgi:glycosyltransferase involved in cell wall biosynthesis
MVLLLGFGLFKSYGFYKENKKARLSLQKSQIHSADTSFTVLVLAHNNSSSCEKNLFSILTQNYPDFRIIYIDDASTDDTFEKVSSMAERSPLKNKISFIRNKKPNGGLASFYEIIQRLPDQEVVVLVHAADSLAHENVLTKLSKVYSKPSTWMTYGNCLDYPSYRQAPTKCRQFPKNVVFNNSFRSHEMLDMHLKTFYAGLFKQIHKEDLCYKEKFISSDATLAYFLPLLEMAGKHAYFIHEILYLHATSRSTPPLSSELVSYIRKLPQYKRLKALPFEMKSSTKD